MKTLTILLLCLWVLSDFQYVASRPQIKEYDEAANKDESNLVKKRGKRAKEMGASEKFKARHYVNIDEYRELERLVALQSRFNTQEGLTDEETHEMATLTIRYENKINNARAQQDEKPEKYHSFVYMDFDVHKMGKIAFPDQKDKLTEKGRAQYTSIKEFPQVQLEIKLIERTIYLNGNAKVFHDRFVVEKDTQRQDFDHYSKEFNKDKEAKSFSSGNIFEYYQGDNGISENLRTTVETEEANRKQELLKNNNQATESESAEIEENIQKLKEAKQKIVEEIEKEEQKLGDDFITELTKMEEENNFEKRDEIAKKYGNDLDDLEVKKNNQLKGLDSQQNCDPASSSKERKSRQVGKPLCNRSRPGSSSVGQSSIGTRPGLSGNNCAGRKRCPGSGSSSSLPGSARPESSSVLGGTGPQSSSGGGRPVGGSRPFTNTPSGSTKPGSFIVGRPSIASRPGSFIGGRPVGGSRPIPNTPSGRPGISSVAGRPSIGTRPGTPLNGRPVIGSRPPLGSARPGPLGGTGPSSSSILGSGSRPFETSGNKCAGKKRCPGSGSSSNPLGSTRPGSFSELDVTGPQSSSSLSGRKPGSSGKDCAGRKRCPA